MDENRIVDLLEIIVKKPMHQAVPEGRNGDIAALAVAHRETAVWPMSVGAAHKFGVEIA